MEQELGGELFLRTKRHVSITDAGKVFLAESKILLEQANHAKKTVKHAFSGNVGELVLGFVESATWAILPQTIPIFYMGEIDTILPTQTKNIERPLTSGSSQRRSQKVEKATHEIQLN